MRKLPGASSMRSMRDSRAVAAVEFAFVFPALLIIMLTGLQLVAYIDATRKVERIAASVSEMISQAAPPQNSTTALITTADLHFGYDSALVLFPYIMTDAPQQNMAWWQDIEVDFAGVRFTQTNSSCTNSSDLSACYVPQVMWTSTIGSHTRQCSSNLTPVDNAAGTNSGTLPKGVYGPSSLIVIDVRFTFRPSFASAILPAIAIARSAYVAPRYASLIKLNTTNNDASATACPGFF